MIELMNIESEVFWAILQRKFISENDFECSKMIINLFEFKDRVFKALSPIEQHIIYTNTNFQFPGGRQDENISR